MLTAPPPKKPTQQRPALPAAESEGPLSSGSAPVAPAPAPPAAAANDDPLLEDDDEALLAMLEDDSDDGAAEEGAEAGAAGDAEGEAVDASLTLVIETEPQAGDLDVE